MTDRLIIPASEEAESAIWTSVAYTLCPKLNPQIGLVAVAGKACGIRSDGQAFWATYDLPWIYPQGFDWTAKAKERLDSFLECSCSISTGACNFHRVAQEEWFREDELRNHIRVEDIPSALRGHLGPPEQDPNRPRIIRPS
jgi:hypothetical protein